MQESQVTQATQQNKQEAADKVKQAWRKPTVTFVTLDVATQQTS